MKYSQARRQAVLARLAPPRQRTVKEVAAEAGISPATLYHGRQQARRGAACSRMMARTPRAGRRETSSPR